MQLCPSIWTSYQHWVKFPGFFVKFFPRKLCNIEKYQGKGWPSRQVVRNVLQTWWFTLSWSNSEVPLRLKPICCLCMRLLNGFCKNLQFLPSLAHLSRGSRMLKVHFNSLLRHTFISSITFNQHNTQAWRMNFNLGAKFSHKTSCDDDFWLRSSSLCGLLARCLSLRCLINEAGMPLGAIEGAVLRCGGSCPGTIQASSPK